MNAWKEVTRLVGKTAERASKTVGKHLENAAEVVQQTAEGTIATGKASIRQVQSVKEKATRQVGKATEATIKTVDETVNFATDVVQETVEDAVVVGKASVEHLQRTTEGMLKTGGEFVEGTVEAVQDTGAALKQNTLQAAEATWATVDHIGSQAGAVTQAQMKAMTAALEHYQTVLLAAGASGVVITQALKDLPRTAQQLAQEMPELARRIQTAGLRSGDGPRLDADVMALFNKIPGTSKLDANQHRILDFLQGKDGSHIKPHAKGGGHEASNILWETRLDNIRRGAETMTGGEQIYIRFYNAVESLLKNSPTIARLGLQATAAAVVTQALVTALSYALDLYRGDITVEEFRDKIIETAKWAGITTPIFFLLFVVVMALFPEVVVILSAPIVVTGFNALFVVSIALPIIQSIIRHVEAGGFGEEAKVQYAAAIQQGDEMLQTASEMVMLWWRDLFAAGQYLTSEAFVYAF